MAELTLLRNGHPLANPREQVTFLKKNLEGPTFQAVLAKHDYDELKAQEINTLQLNVGKVCNQTCNHCHVDAGPDRTESMSAKVAEACLRLLSQAGIGTLDITGGAPEMNPCFRRLAAC